MRDVPVGPDWRGACGPPLAESASFRLFTEGDDLYEAMISAIGRARRSIRLESFIFAADEIGWQFATALSAKARAAVDVRFHFDSRGALTGFLPDLFREMANAGVALKWYRPWSWRHPRRYFQRNHRKLLIVDGQELFLGGFNVQLERAARYAARRTVDVRLLVPRQSDPPFVGWLTRSGYARLMADGVRIYEYHPARKLHAKTALIDDEWCVVGSPNLDHLSLFVNHELALVARDRGLADALRDQYFVDLDDASEVQPSVWAKRGWTERAVEAIGWAARGFL